MSKVLVTGGSGFIGTNMVDYLLDKACDVLSIDVNPPQSRKHCSIFQKVDILDLMKLAKVVNEYKPTYILNFAARTDLDGKTIDDYAVNTTGVKNLVTVVSQQPSVKRCVFASTKLVCKNGYNPKYDDDYCPNTLYGQSKVAGEEILRADSSLNCEWCIVRPTSIWGPWFDVPYKDFFLVIAKGLYFHPGKIDPPQSFGYVGNTVYQTQKLLEAPGNIVHSKTFYLSDYQQYTIRMWASIISKKLKNKKIIEMPEVVIRFAAWMGDIMKELGLKNPPITSFRLSNMRTDTTCIPLAQMKEISGPLPYMMEDGVELTVKWLKNQKLI